MGGSMRQNSRGYLSRLRSGERPSPPKGTTVSNEDIIAGLGEIVEEVAGVAAADVTVDKSFTDDLDIDSLSMVEIAVQAEDKFGVKIPDDELANLKTVGDAVDYIAANKA
jgi:acyl carrier protein